jgi:recombination protein RecR
LARVADEEVKEIILALSPSVEGEATSLYLTKLLKPFNIKISRIAFGIPADSGILYTDPITLKRAFNGRLPASKINLN